MRRHVYLLCELLDGLWFGSCRCGWVTIGHHRRETADGELLDHVLSATVGAR